MTFESNPINAKAAADLSTKIKRCGKHTATGINVCTVAGERVDGVIGSKPKALGDGMDLFIDRLSPVELGGTVAEGDELATDANGRAIKSVEGQFSFGIAAEAGVNLQYIAWRQKLGGSASVANVADTQLRPGQLGVFTFAIPDAVGADNDKVMTNKVEVLDVVVQKRGGANVAGTVIVKSTAAAISNLIASDTDLAVTRAGTLDDVNSTIVAGGILRVTHTKPGANSLALVSVYVIGRA